MPTAVSVESATSVACPACNSHGRLTSADVSTAAPLVATEIARGGDLGGILELAHALVSARVEAGIAGDQTTTEALQAAAVVIIKLARVVAEFRKLGVVVPSPSCPACELRLAAAR
jgi:hypothetical protein